MNAEQEAMVAQPVAVAVVPEEHAVVEQQSSDEVGREIYIMVAGEQKTLVRVWALDGVSLPTRDVEGKTCIVLSKCWASNRPLLKLLIGKNCPDKAKGKWSSQALPQCQLACEVLERLRQARGKRVRMMRRVDKEGQPLPVWQNLTGDDGDGATYSIKALDQHSAVCIELDSKSLKWLMTRLGEEAVAVNNLCKESSISASALRATPFQDDVAGDACSAASGSSNEEAEDDAAAIARLKRNLPACVFFADDRKSYMVTQNVGEIATETRRTKRTEFHVRHKAPCALDEYKHQRDRALHFHETSEVIENRAIKRNAESNCTPIKHRRRRLPLAEAGESKRSDEG